jgi:hypothetical protein
MNTVPVTLSEIYQGFASGSGLVRDEGEALCLEFQVKDSVVGLLKSEIKQVRIPRADLASVAIRSHFFGLTTKLIIGVNRLESVQDVPGMEQGRIILHVARKDRAAAEQLVAGLRLAERA